MADNHDSQTSQPAERVVQIDMTDEIRLHASVAALDDTDRFQLADALRTYESGERERAIINTVRETVAEDASAHPDIYTDTNPAVGVLFCTDEWDNGYFLDQNATVLLADGTTTDVEFPLHDEMTEEFGSVGKWFTVAVDLRTGTLECDDYGDHQSIHQMFRVSEPVPKWRADDPATLAWWRDHGGLPEDLTIEGTTFPDPGHAIGYLTLKRMPSEQVLYLARSQPERLKERADTVYCRVATESTEPAWVTQMAARVAFAAGWIDSDEYARLTS